jgi:membrane associated rhomboid family serine protease
MEPQPPTTDAPPTCYRHKDRETLVSCSNCDRPICTSCMVQAAVGVRCPECAGRATGVARLKPRAVSRGTAYLTIALIAVNVVVFGLQLATDPGGVGSGLGGSVSSGGWLNGPDVAGGDWWRIVTSGFLHAGVVHLGFNMVALWVLGSRFEAYIGPLRFALIYFASVLWGSAGALLLNPTSNTVGASGGVFGLMAAIFLLERQRGIAIFGDTGVWLGLNLIITFALPGISIGGHLGGIVGGALAALALSGFGKRHMAARRLHGATTIAAVAVVVIGAVGALVIAERRSPDPVTFGARGADRSVVASVAAERTLPFE